MTKTVYGVVHGKTIELNEELGVAEGETVAIQVKVVKPPVTAKWGDGIQRSAGGWADHPEMDAIMKTIQEQRQLERRPQMRDE